MKPNYLLIVKWIALNDDPGAPDATLYREVSRMMTVVRAADVFGLAPIKVAKDVVSYRLKLKKENRK